MALALVILCLGFAIEMGPLGQMAGQAIAAAMAVGAAGMLALMDVEVVRSGVELRSITSDWAVRVSEVCDGMGLVVALVAAVIACARPGQGLRLAARQIALGVVLIQGFNLLRVVGLALALDGWPAGFGLLHDHVFPLLTVLVIGAALLPARVLLRLAALTAGFSLLWTPVAGLVSAWLVPLANLALPLGLAGVGEIAVRDGAWSVGTLFLAGIDPVRLFVAPLEPQHFTLALPVLCAAVLLTRQPLWLLLILPLMLLALTIAAPVAVWALAAAEPGITLLRADGAGAFVPETYTLPETLRAVLRVVQNGLVHFLLLVLPVLILQPDRKAATA